MPHLPARLLRPHPAALQAQLLPGLHQRGLGQGLPAGPLPRVQPRILTEAQPGKEPQAVQHLGEVQRSERGEARRAAAAVHPVSPRTPAPRCQGVPALQRPLLSVPRPDPPAAALLGVGPPAGGGRGREVLDLSPAR